LPFAGFSWTGFVDDCRMRSAREAEAGSAEEQPAKEYLVGNSFR
jgi:hypothetical protein